MFSVKSFSPESLAPKESTDIAMTFENKGNPEGPHMQLLGDWDP